MQDKNSLINAFCTGMVKEVTGDFKVVYHPVEGDADNKFTVDFTPPFRRVRYIDLLSSKFVISRSHIVHRMIPELEKQLKVSFPASSEFASEKFRNFLDGLCIKHNVDCGHPRTATRLLDKVP